MKQSSDHPKLEVRRVQTRSSAAAAAIALRSEGARTEIAPLLPFGAYSDEVDHRDSGPPESQQESIRVTYEDPNQRDERQRLMNILKGKSSQSGETSRGRTPRIPGF